MRHLIGSNQHRTKDRFLTYNNERRVLWLLVFMLVVVIIGREWKLRHPIISPCPERGCLVTKVEAAEIEKRIALTQELAHYRAQEKESLKPLPENIIAYIAKKWSGEGTANIVKAIDCFNSESHLRYNAYNWNPPYVDKNGVSHPATEDRGVAQINSIHRLTISESEDFIKNIDTAFAIYSRRGWSAWYGSACN